MQQILILEKVESDHILHFCLKNVRIDANKSNDVFSFKTCFSNVIGQKRGNTAAHHDGNTQSGGKASLTPSCAAAGSQNDSQLLLRLHSAALFSEFSPLKSHELLFVFMLLDGSSEAESEPIRR